MKLLKFLALAAGIALFAWILATTDLKAVGDYVLRVGGTGILVINAVFLIGFSADVGAWLLLFRSLDHTRAWFGRLWIAQLVGEAVNILAPFGSLGGEPVKAILLKRRHDVSYSESAASIVLAQTVNSLAEVPFAIIGVILLMQQQLLPPAVETLIVGATAVITVFMLGVMLVLHLRSVATLVQRLSYSRWGARLAKGLAFVKETEDHLFHIVRKSPAQFIVAFFLSFVVWVFGGIEMYLIFHFLGLPISMGDAWIMETVIVLVRSATFFVPGHLGAQDGAITLVARALTGSPDMGLAVALVRRGRELLWGAIGVALGGWLGLRRTDTADA